MTRFLFDRNTPRALARVIDAYDRDRTVLFFDDDARFERTTLDLDWLRVLGTDMAPPWAVVSMDRRILTRPEERAALTMTRVRFFLLGRGWARMTGHEQAWRLLKAWPNIVAAAEGGRGQVFEVTTGAQHKVERRD